MQAVALAGGQSGKIQEPAWGVVGQHIIYLPAVCFQVRLAGGIFFVGGHLLRPPVHTGLPVLFVRTFRPAKAEVFFALQLQHTAPADMIHIAAQCLHFAAKQFHRGVLGQQVIVFVGAVQKQQGVGALAQPVQPLALCGAAVPYKAKISQHQHHVPLAQPAELAVLEAVQLAMRITCEIYHPFPPCRFVKQLQKPCHTPANLLL